jgi:hypothetical protein
MASVTMVSEFPIETLKAFYLTLTHEPDAIPGVVTFGLDHETVRENMPLLVETITYGTDVTAQDIHKIAGEIHAYRHKQSDKISKALYKIMEKFGIRFHVPEGIINTAKALSTAAALSYPSSRSSSRTSNNIDTSRDVPSPLYEYDSDEESMGESEIIFPLPGARRKRKSRVNSKKSKKSKKSLKAKKSKKSLKAKKSKKSLKVKKSKKAKKHN